MDNHQQPVRRSQRLLSYLICTLIAGQPLLPAVAAAITPVTPGSQMDKAANGVPVLNIATPNQAGISHNQFSDYNVGKPGLILNNATDRLTQTQLGGLIQNNPNLKAGKEARGIINEVVGGNRSQLQGFTEVAGKAANVMVVNPYGITCNGCGFINTPQVTLTTGKPTFDSQGNVSSLAVSKGTIIVEGQGLNASQSDALSIIARATEINADIHARDLTVIAGSNRVDAQGKVTAQGSQDPQPSVAVDTGALGGMYANRIRLVSSDKGVGVNLGNLNARQGDITLDASGKLTVNNSLASGALSVRAGTVALIGDHKAGGDITVSSDGDVALKNAALVSDRDVIINAGKTGALESGKLTAGRDIQLSGDALTLDSASQANAAGDIRATATTLLSQQGQMTAGQDLTLNADALDNRGALNASRNLSARATTLNSQQQSQITSQQSADLQADQMQLGGEVNAGGDLTLTGAQLTTLATAQIQSGGDLRLESGRAVLNGTHAVRGDFTANVTTLEHNGKSNAAHITLTADSLNNRGTLVTPELTLQAKTLTNSGLLEASQAMQLQTNQFDNLQGATLHSAGDLTLDLPIFNNSGLVTGEGALTLGGDTLTNSGEINASNLTVMHRTLNNQQSGFLLAHSALTFEGGVLDNSGQMVGKTLLLQGDSLYNRGVLQGSDAVELHAAQFSADDASRAVSGDALTLNIADISNSGMLQGERFSLTADKLVNAGTLLGNSGLTISAGQLEQSEKGRMLSGGDLNISGHSITSAGQAIATGDVFVALTGDISQQGTLAAGNQLTLSSLGAVSNSGAMQGKGINLSAGTLFSSNGKITSGGIASSLSGGQIDIVDEGSVQAGGDLILTSQSDINIAGFTAAAGELALMAQANIINSALLYAGKNMRLLADSVQNLRGEILAEDNLWIQRDAAGNANSDIINNSGSIETRSGDISLATAHLLNQRDGLTYSVEEKNYYPATAATIRLTLYSSMLQLTDSERCSGGQNPYCYTVRYLGPKEEFLQQKLMVSEKKVTASASGGAATILASQDLIISAGKLENKASNLLAGRKMNLQGKTLDNDSIENGSMQVWQTYKCGGLLWTEACGYSSNTLPSKETFTYTLIGGPVVENLSTGSDLRAVIQAGSTLTASFTSNVSNTTTRANSGTITSTLAVPVLNTLSQPGADGLSSANEQLHTALQQLNNGSMLDSNGKPVTALTDPQGKGVDISAYPLPSGDNGYFVGVSDPKSPYLFVTNPQLDGLGQLDPSLFGDLNELLGKQPGSAPQETRSAFTDQKQFLGSSYLLDRLNVKPEYDYRLLGDAAFDTRYVSNALLNQTGNRYLNGVGSDLEQMRYLLDNAASAQQSLGLQFGVSLDAQQVAALDHSIVWWEATQINGETVMVPKLYLSPKDVAVNSGSVIAANSVELNAGTLTNNGSTLAAKTDLNINSQNSISNLNAGLISAAGDMNLSALGDINNIGSAISGKTLTLESLDGSINNQTLATQWNASSNGWFGSSVAMSQTQLGTTATMSAQQGVTLKAGKDITVTGSKVTAGGDLKLDAAGDIAINANQTSSSSRYTGYAGKNIASSGKVDNVGSDLSAGGSLTLNAGNDLSATASAISATKDLSLTAGHDLNLNAADTAQRSSKGKGENHVTGQDRTTLTSGNDLTLSAGRDLNSQAAGLVADNDVTLKAGRDVNLLAATTTKGDSYHSSERTEIHEAVRQQGTEIASGGNTAVQAGRDINSAATQVTAQQDIALNAGNDVNLTTATESDYFYKEETKTKKGFLSKKTTHTIKEDYSTSEKGTLLSGDNVSVEAGKNILVKGSQVVGDDNVTLKAASNIDIVAATNTDSSWRFSETKKSGLMGTGGIGITIGTSSQKHDLKVKGTTQSQSVSTVGSTGGNVTVSAADGVKISGADLVAGQSLTVNGDSVVIAPGHDKRTADERFEQKSTGITLALSGAVGEAINNAIATAQAAKGESDSRLAALQATKTALSGVQAKLARQQAQVSGDPNSGIGISISLTTQKSKSQSQQVSDAVSGSTLNAGQNLAITATGKGQSANSGDIAIGGSQLKAGGDTTLTAANDILLTGAANTQQSTGSNSSGGGGVGISFGVGNGSAGLSIFASVNGAKGKDTGNGTQWSETTLDSGGNVSLNSGRDTTLTGAQVNGNKVSADVGRNLTITSQQDSDRYDSKQTSFGAGGSFTFGSMTASGYINASQDKMHSTYDSVMEQSGIYAGKGGFDIQVGDHTQLNGAVIASQAGADNNRLETGTLGFSDLGNEADYKVSHSGISAGMSNGGSMGGQMLGNVLSNSASTLLAGLNGMGHAEGTTQSAVEQGTIVIRDMANQQQNVASLSRDTASANGSISPIFDKEKEQKRLQTAQAVGEITGQMVSIVNTMGDIKGLEEAKKGAAPLKDNATEKERAKWLAGLRESDAYQKAMSDYGVGSKNQMVVQAVSGVLQGLVNGNISQAVAGAANPLVAQVIKAQTTDAGGNTNVVANAMAHAVWGAVAAQMSGGNAAAGAAGAFSGELATRFIAEVFYHASTPEEIARLSQADKEQLSLLGTIAAGAAGAVAGNSSAAATTGALAGKNAVENNALSAPDDKTRQDAKWALPYLEGDKKAQAEKLVTDLNVKDKAFDAAIDAACKNLSSADCRGMRQELAAMGKSYDAQLDGQYIGTMASVYKEGADKVDSLLWQYATADAQAQKAKDIQTIATNWGVSLETASTLYTSMAGVHTAAAIGGTMYGMKGESVPAAKGSTTETYFRVEGGGSGTKTSQNRINANPDGSVTINSGCSGQLCVSTNGPNHASYYLTNKRADGSVVVFEVDAVLHKQIMDAAVPQKPIPGVPKDPNAPKIVDPNKGDPSVSLELPKVWDRLIEQNSSKARVLTKEEFMNEFGK